MRKVLLLVMERDMPTTRSGGALWGGDPAPCRRKYVIAVNEDIDPESRTHPLGHVLVGQSNLDFHICRHRDQGHGHAATNGGEDGSVLIDATLRRLPADFPAKREFMERAKVIWRNSAAEAQARSPVVRPFAGEWSDEMDKAAKRATEGNYFEAANSLKNAAQGCPHEHRGTKRRRIENKTAQGQEAVILVGVTSTPAMSTLCRDDALQNR